MNLKAYHRLSDSLLVAGVLGGIVSHWIPLPETVHTPLRWVSILIVVLAIGFRLAEAIVQVRARLKWEAAYRARNPREKKAVPAERRQFPTALYLISLSVAALGLALIFLVPAGYQGHVMQSAASEWPHTVGEVISAEVVRRDRHNVDQGDDYQPRIITEYIVNGGSYTTREIHFNQSSSWRTDSSYAYAMTEKFAPGTKVDVYYDPDNPYIAVLDRSTDWFTYFLMAFGAILVICGVYWFWLSLRDTFLFVKELVGRRPTK